MGIPMSLLGKLGLPGMQDKVYEKYFKNIKTFDQFHSAFLDFCNVLNAVMPGMHYTAPSSKIIEKCYHQWEKESDVDKKKNLVETLLKENVHVGSTNNSAIVMTGMVVPPAAMLLKKVGDNVPQVRKFRLNLVPDIVFVPAVTVAALFGVKVLQIKSNDTA